VSAATADQVKEARWEAEDTSIAEVGAALDRLQHGGVGDDRQHAAARSLNLIVAPGPAGERATEVERELERAALRHSWRTIELKMHNTPRLDAMIRLTFSPMDETGNLGIYHDRITLTTDRTRLEHADALLLPLMVSSVDTVMWLPSGKFGLIDARIARLAHHLVLDTAQDFDPRRALRRAAYAQQHIAVHDVTWGRLSWWRARIAAAFDDEANCALLDTFTGLEIDFTGSAAVPLLLVGWVGARLGLRIDELWPARAHWTGRYGDGEGRRVDIDLRHKPAESGYGGIERVSFVDPSKRIDLERGGVSDRQRDLVPEALQPLEFFARGYRASLNALNEQLETTWQITA
jgi:glucose-6-phosphate dehydrogenase assembly protein OpcA